MTASSNSPKKLTHQAIATALGVSRVRVTQLVGKGMPVTTLDEAKAWHANHAKEGLGHKGGGGEAQAEVAQAVAKMDITELGPMPSRGSAEYRVWIARKTHCEAAYAVEVAQERAKRTGRPEDSAIIPAHLRTLNQAEANRAEAEDRWEKHRMRTGEVVPIALAKTVITNALEPIMVQLGTLAKSVAPAANPTDAALAEKVITEAVAKIRTQVAELLAANAQ